MRRPGERGGWGAAFAWLVFPLAPAMLGRGYFEAFHSLLPRVSDPRTWNWQLWLLLTGPLWGYGFLAGATLGLDDPPGARGPRSWLGRRALWVGVGPWAGFVAWSAVEFLNQAGSAVHDWFRPGRGPWEWRLPFLPNELSGWWREVAWWALSIGAFVGFGYGWLAVAAAALRRARRAGRLRQALERGLVAAVAFVGSLFGSFWAITSAWRSYYFDSRMAPLLAIAAGLAVLGGCASPATYGEIRRGRLFEALLTAWLLGLALAWRWWSRPRGRGG